MIRVRFLLVLALAVGISLLPTYAQDKARDQQLADLEKQIQALNKKLADLKGAGTATATAASATASVADGTIPTSWIKSVTWRSIGPANMSGRITAFAVYEADPTTYWVASASGGLVKTVNNGITFEHQFNHESTVSIGDVCVAPSDRNIVWVGTGEANPRNSVSYGDGVYKSTDSGKTWHNMGLKNSYQIGRIQIHPKDPNTVYVGALGRLYGSNEERGLFKTTDGGKNWQKILYIDNQTGIIDIAVHPTEPDTLLVAMWDRERDGFDDFLGDPPPEGSDRYDPVRKYGKGAGIYKSTDGGKTFKKLTAGLPTCNLGRIGIDYSRKHPNTVYALVDSEKYGTGLPLVTVMIGLQGKEAGGGLKLTEVAANSPAARAGLKVDDVLLTVDGKTIANRAALFDALRPHKPGEKVKVAYERGKDKKEAEITLARRGGQGNRGGGGGGRGPGSMLSPGFMGQEAEGGGVIVTRMVEDGPAAKAGLQFDDLVTAIDGEPVTQLGAILGKIARTKRAGDKVTLQIVRGTEKKELSVTLSPTQFGRLESKPIPGRTKRPYNAGTGGGNRENVQDEQGPDGFESGGLYRSSDGGETWTRVNSINPRPMYFTVVRVDPTDDNIIYVAGFELHRSKDGGKTFEDGGNRGVHSDLHALWIDPTNGRHMLLGSDGGFYQTYDRAEHWDHMNSLALGQFYHVTVDPRPLYRVYGGLQDNASWAGPSRTLHAAGPINDDWLMLGGGDGFVVRPDPTDPDLVYAESQDGNIFRRDLKTGERATIRPKRIAGQPEHRFNWNTPFILSAHNPSIFYSAGEYVFRSVNKGDNLHIISPEITHSKKGSGTALAESPKNPDVPWVGTDDGALWVTRNGGVKWTEVDANVKLSGPRWVASIEPSHVVEGRAYVVFDAHRSNDDEPYVFVTEDYGQTWKSLRANLPTGSTRCCSEDIENPNLLYLGTEFGAWISTNRGESWTKLNNNLPTVAVHEFAQHPTSGEVIAATHGRSLWVLDVTALRQMTATVLKDKAHLYRPNKVVRWRVDQGRDGWFDGSGRRFVGENPPTGAVFYYSLGQKAERVSLKVLDYTGKVVAELPGKADAGLHTVSWNLQEGSRGGRGGRGGAGRGVGAGRAGSSTGGGSAGGARRGSPTPTAGQPTAPAQAATAATQVPATPAEEEPPADLPFFMGGGRPAAVAPGMYHVVLTVDGADQSQWLQIEPDPRP
jgi:photosystem II stability/assembly factor-like uncharacterized protein